MRKVFLAVLLAVMLASLPALAIHPDEVLADPVLEARARAITQGVRCLVCQGESVDESAAPLAADLRRLVRARLVAGDSDAAVKSYLTARYGDYILMRPPFSARSALLWLMPFALLGVAAGIVWRRQRAAVRRRRA